MKIVTQDNIAVNPTINTIELNLGQLEKGGYPHFMLKEIFEQPDCIHDCMRGRINIEGTDIALSAIIDHKEKLLHAKRFIIVACGTSWHAALIGKYLIEKFCRFPVEVEYASEFRYRNPVINPGDVVIAISQSGETADTLAAVEEANMQCCRIFYPESYAYRIVHTRRTGNRCCFYKSIYRSSYSSHNVGSYFGTRKEQYR